MLYLFYLRIGAAAGSLRTRNARPYKYGNKRFSFMLYLFYLRIGAAADSRRTRNARPYKYGND